MLGRLRDPASLSLTSSSVQARLSDFEMMQLLKPALALLSDFFSVTAPCWELVALTRLLALLDVADDEAFQK